MNLEDLNLQQNCSYLIFTSVSIAHSGYDLIIGLVTFNPSNQILPGGKIKMYDVLDVPYY
jgi:hypothetical protein